MSSTLNINLFSILEMKLLSERVKHIIKNAKIEAAEIVTASGASHSVVSQWISGDIKSMNLKYALGIERKYGYNHVWLMINEGPEKVSSDKKIAVSANSDTATADDLVRLVNVFNSSDESQRSLILAAVTTAERASRKAAAGGN